MARKGLLFDIYRSDPSAITLNSGLMAVLLEQRQVVVQQCFELYWVCRVGTSMRAGTIFHWAESPEVAIETIRRYPDWFGLTEGAIIGHATNLRIGEGHGVRLN